LKRGKKKETPEEEKGYIRNKLRFWRDNVLDEYYGGMTGISGRTLMSDDVVDKIAGCGERPRSYAELRRHVVWALIHDGDTGGPNEWGERFILALQDIYKVLDAYDEERAEEEKRVEGERLEAQTQARYEVNTRSDFNIQTPRICARNTSEGWGESDEDMEVDQVELTSEEETQYRANVLKEFVVLTPESYSH